MKLTLLVAVLGLGACAALSGCTSTQHETKDALTQTLETQAQVISQQLPLNENGITLVRAHAEDPHTLMLDMIQNKGPLEGKQFLTDYSVALCRDKTVRQRLSEGGIYQLSLYTLDKQTISHTLSQCDN